MRGVKIEIEEPLAAILSQTNQSVEHAGREMIVLELYRRGTISSGKAGELLGMPRIRLHPARVAPRHPLLRADCG
jgi:predicted HTH domain antitoxin